MAKKGSSAARKERYKQYKSTGKREKHKATRFENKIKEFIKQAEAGKIRTKKPTTVNGKLKWEKTTTDKWTFGPFKVIPNWMSPIIDRYKDHYKKDFKVKKKKIRSSTKETLEAVRSSERMFRQAKSFKKRSGTGVSPSKKN